MANNLIDPIIYFTFTPCVSSEHDHLAWFDINIYPSFK